MGFLDKLFGGNIEQRPDFWKSIETENDLDQAIKDSFDKKIVIFKHSTRCFISKSVLKSFEREVEKSDKNISYYFLDLLAHRDLSNKIAEDFKVQHQSPQLIVIENGVAVKNESHQSITLNLV